MKNRKRVKYEKTKRIKNKKILKKYPFLAPVDWYGHKMSNKQHKYNFTILDDIPRGWEKLLLQFSEDIRPILIKGNYLNEYYFVQLKEKWGRLVVFSNSIPKSISKEVDRLISDYEIMSENVCIDCGSPYAKMCNVSWIIPFCEKCFKKYYHNIDYSSVTKENDIMDNTYKITRWGNRNKTEEVIDISDKVAKIKSKWRVK